MLRLTGTIWSQNTPRVECWTESTLSPKFLTEIFTVASEPVQVANASGAAAMTEAIAIATHEMILLIFILDMREINVFKFNGKDTGF